MTKILFHPCKNKYQDEKYGEFQRVFNLCKSDTNRKKYRCTSCGGEVVKDSGEGKK